jgi:hypothetical protein
MFSLKWPERFRALKRLPEQQSYDVCGIKLSVERRMA